MDDVTAVQPPCDEDAALLVAAHLDLLEAQARGVTVLGSAAGGELVMAARELLGMSVSDAVALTLDNGGRVWLTGGEVSAA